VCVAKCVDLVEQGGMPPSEGAQAFCESNARVSTNLDPSTCLNGVCTDGGTLKPDFVDPRREQEEVTWVDLGGDASALDNNLSKLTGASGAFDSGARSQEIITHGDAWVEFAANETGVSHVVGVSHDDGGLDDPSLADVEFAISRNYDGAVYIVEDNAEVINGPFGTYAPGERFRLQAAGPQRLNINNVSGDVRIQQGVALQEHFGAHDVHRAGPRRHDLAPIGPRRYGVSHRPDAVESVREAVSRRRHVRQYHRGRRLPCDRHPARERYQVQGDANRCG
jgi:hypothetical protein